jgi:hypothetical protein
MLGRKNQPQASPVLSIREGNPIGWSVQVLMPESVISATLAPTDMALSGYLNAPAQMTMVLLAAHIRPLTLATMLASANPAEMIVNRPIVAFIPRDEAWRGA